MKKATSSIIGLLLLVLAPASTGGGFLGSIIDQIAPRQGKNLDEVHRQAGAPVDSVVLPAFATMCEVQSVGICYLETHDFLPPGRPCKCVFEDGRSLPGVTR